MGINIALGIGILKEKIIPEKRNFPNFMDAYMKLADYSEAPRKYHTWTCLSIIAGALEKRVWFAEYPTPVFPNLYVVLIGSPAARKSTATQFGMSLLEGIPDIFYIKSRETDAALIDTLQHSCKKFTYFGQDIKHSSAFCYVSELATMLENPYGIISTYLTDLYDSRRHNAVWSIKTKGGGVINVTGPNINLLGCATQSSIKDCIPVEKMDAGFASRINFIVETVASENVIAIAKHSIEKDEYEKLLLNDLLIINSLQGEAKLESNAERYFKEWYAGYKKLIDAKDYDPRFEGYYGRKSNLVKKLMVNTSVQERNDLIITRKHIIDALNLIEDNEKAMFSLFEFNGSNEKMNATSKIVEYIKTKGVVKQTDIKRRFMCDLDPTDCDQLLTHLCSMEILQPVIEPKLSYRIHPSYTGLYNTIGSTILTNFQSEV